MSQESEPGRQQALERLLGRLAGETAMATIEDRIADSGHLEESDYEKLRAAAAAGTGIGADASTSNLRRHVLFCAVCGAEYLRRAAPESEPEAGAEAGEVAAGQAGGGSATPRGRRVRHSLVSLGLSALLLTVLLFFAVKWMRSLTGDTGGKPPRSPDAGFAGDVTASAGTGRRFGRPDAAGRLFVHRAGARAGRPVHAHAFLLAEGRVTPLDPGDGTEVKNPPLGDLLPSEGWTDPGGGRPRHLLLILADETLPALATAGDRSSAATSLERCIGGGLAIADVIPILDGLRGTVPGVTLVLQIEE